MSRDRRPLFTPDWPRYAVVAHVAFWATSALLLVVCAAAAAGWATGGAALLLTGGWIVAGVFLGAAALLSGRLYVGDQVFARAPTTGWPARLYGGFVAAGGVLLLLFFYALTTSRGG